MLCRIGRASATLVAARGVRSRALRAAPKVVVQSRILARQSPLRTTSVRLYSGEAPAFDVLAKQIEDKLRAGLKDVKHVTIQDARGDGSFLHIWVVSADFEGKLPLKQHQLVNSLLKDEIATVHGVTLKTQTPSAYERTR